MPSVPPGDGSQMRGSKPGSSRSPRKRLLLCMSHISPWPTFAAASYRLHRLLSWFEAQDWQVVLVHRPDGASSGGEGLRSPSERYRDVITIDADGNVACVAGTARVRSAIEELGSAPDLVHALIKRLRPGAVIATEPAIARDIPGSGAKGRRLLVDLDGTLTSARRAGSEERAALPERGWVVASTAPALTDDVAQADARASRVTIGTAFDVAATGKPATGSTVLLVGSDTAENRTGLDDFLEFAWPLVRLQNAQAELVIAGTIGRGLTLPTGAGVRLLGTVDDIDSLYETCVAAIDPAVDGTSPHVKTAEALAYLRPIVTWPGGVIGLPAGLRDMSLVATDWFAFARNVTLAMSSPFAGAQLQRRRADVDRLLSPESAYSALAAAMSTVSSPGA